MPSRALLCLLVQLSLGGIAAGQDIVTTDLGPDPSVQTKLDAEGLPEFAIEIVVFAYNAFDPTEEDFANTQKRLSSASPSAPNYPPSDPADEGPISEDAARTPADQLTSDIDPGQSPRRPFQFKMMGSDDLTLTAARDKLERLDAYTVLVHGGWIQEGLSERDAHEIDMALFGEPRLSGTLQFHLERFAHVTAAVDYHASTDGSRPLQATGSATGDKSMNSAGRFELHQTRRLRSGELHYLDHPAFGLLVVVRPYAEGRERNVASGARSERSTRPAA